MKTRVAGNVVSPSATSFKAVKVIAMTLVKIEKKNWAEGLTAAADAYRLFGPVKEKDYHQFKELEKGEMPDFEMVNTRLSPKALLFPQSEEMLEYSLD